MRKILSASILGVCAIGALGLFGCSNGLVQSGIQPVNPPPTQPAAEHQNGIVQDWSMHQVVYPLVGPIDSMTALQHDPRAILSWQAAERQHRGPRHFFNIGGIQRDWSISLGGGTTAPAQYPAKYGFDVTAAPDCNLDVVFFTVNTTTSATQPNIVGFNNLYSGGTSAVPTGLCGSRAVVAGDDRSKATVDWSYNVIAADGQVSTSPALSLDGAEVAFVETGSGGTAHFHVLAPSPGDGVNLGTPNLQDVTQPVTINAAFPFVATLVEGTGNATDLALNIGATQSDTLSSPFIDYADNLAYVGNDSGELFRIKNVFCIAAALVCQFPGAGAPAPSLDTSWGSGTGAISVCSGKLSGPVIDGGNGNIFVGCSDGKIYGFTSSGLPLANPSVIVGNGAATGGVVDTPMVDAVNHWVYAVAGASGGGTEVVVQASTTNLGSTSTATLGAGGQFNMHDPSFNNAYFNGGGTAFLYAWGLNGAGTQIELWGITFGALKAMTPGTPVNFLAIGSAVELSPSAEFFNGGTGVDGLFVGGLTNLSPNFLEANVTAGFPGGFSANTTEGNGTSGIIVDNQSGSAQASSIYVGVLGSNTAVKLTQSGLN